MFPTVKICLIFVEMQVLPEAEDLFNRDSVAKMFDILDADSQGELNFEEFKKAQKMFESHAESDTKGPETPNDTPFAGTTPNAGSVELGNMNREVGREVVVE